MGVSKLMLKEGKEKAEKATKGDWFPRCKENMSERDNEDDDARFPLTGIWSTDKMHVVEYDLKGPVVHKLSEDDSWHICFHDPKQMLKIYKMIDDMKELIQWLACPPYPDVDPKDVLDGYRKRASVFLKKNFKDE